MVLYFSCNMWYSHAFAKYPVALQLNMSRADGDTITNKFCGGVIVAGGREVVLIVASSHFDKNPQPWPP